MALPNLLPSMPDHRALIVAGQNAPPLPLGVRMILSSSLTIITVGAFFYYQKKDDELRANGNSHK